MEQCRKAQVGQFHLGIADAIIVTGSCYERLIGLQPQVPVISVSFTIEQQSIDFVRSRVLG